MNRVGQRLRRGGYLLPSAFTVGNLLLGFYAIVRGFRGDFPQAALLIFGAGVLDSLDGRIARLTGTESDFGREYDSLADVVTFGAAPALL
ncbi:MAG: CDP-alcohol phosphatidyltransferase family protein, partial [Acidobacteriota bacterium]